MDPWKLFLIYWPLNGLNPFLPNFTSLSAFKDPFGSKMITILASENIVKESDGHQPLNDLLITISRNKINSISASKNLTLQNLNLSFLQEQNEQCISL